MRKFAIIGASALVLALGVTSASAERNYDGTPSQTPGQAAASDGYSATPTLHEGRAAAIQSQGIDPVILEHNGVR